MTDVSQQQISFTDTNAETGAIGGRGGGTASMRDILGQLRKKEAEKTMRSEMTKKISAKEKKRKKNKKKGKMKKVREADRYEPENYLLRIEGAICCASLILIIIWFVLTILLIIILIAITRGNFYDLMFAQPK